MARVSCPTFVGRSPELRQLEAAFARASDGAACTMLLGGDAGIGKTRLIDEFVAALQGRARVLLGSCIGLARGTLPYAPMVEVLRQLVSDPDQKVAEALSGPGRNALARLLPEAAPPESDNREPLSPGNQSRLFESLQSLLVCLGTMVPTVIVLEDLHWADTSTTDLIAFLARKLRHGRILIIGTFRTDELRRRHPLRGALAELGRAGRVERMELHGFGKSELTEQLRGITGERLPLDVIEAVLSRSEGNAFFVEELVASGDILGELPPTLRNVVLARVEGLPEAAQRALRGAAVVGRRVEHTLLAAVAGMSETELEDGLRAAVNEQILLSEPNSDSYLFRHALTQEAVYGDLLPGERKRLHALVAGFLAARPVLTGAAGARQAAELAYHWYAARDLRAALPAALRAGEMAEKLSAPAEGQAHYERALDLWDKLDDADTIVGWDHVTLLSRAGYCALLAGATDRAIVLTRSALDEVNPEVDSHRAALLHEQLGWCHTVVDDIDSACAAWGTARKLLEEEPPSADKARVIAGEARSLMQQLRNGEAVALARQALSLARRVGDRVLEGRTLCTLGTSLASMGLTDAGLADLALSRAIASREGTPEDLLRSYANLCMATDVVAGRSEEAVRIAREGIAEAQRLGVMGAIGVHVVAYGAEALLRLGRWDEAEEMAGLAVLDERHTSAAIRRSHVLAAIEIRRGHLDQARSRLDRLADEGAGAGKEAWSRLHSRRAELALWEGDSDAALKSAKTGLSVLAQTDDELYISELCVLAVRSVIDSTWAEAEVSALLEEARRLCRRPLASGASISPEASVHAMVIEAEYSRRVRSDPDRWAAVAAEWLQLSRPYDFAYAKWRQGEALLASHGDRVLGAQALREAHHTAAELGAAPLATEIARLATRARIDLTPPSPTTPPVSSAGARFGLTAREVEVLTLLDQGRTNREIATELFISEKTASVHVSNILRKLGVRSRFEAAGVGHRYGMA